MPVILSFIGPVDFREEETKNDKNNAIASVQEEDL